MKKYINFFLLLILAFLFCFYFQGYSYTDLHYLKGIYRSGLQEKEQSAETISLMLWKVLSNDVRRELKPACLDSKGNFYVLIETNLFKIAKGEDTARILIHNEEWNHPSSIYSDEEGNIYVVDTGNHRILKYNKDGEFLFQIGEPYPFNYKSPYSCGILILGEHYYHLYLGQDTFGPQFAEYYDDTSFMLASRREIITESKKGYLVNPKEIIVVGEYVFASSFIEAGNIQVFDKTTGNFIESWVEKDIVGDTTPPSTSIHSIGEPKYDYGDGTPLVVTSHTPFIFTALDSGTIPSGISHTECTLDNDTAWLIATQTGEDTFTGAKIFTFFISQTYSNGMHTIYYRSVDNAGNIEDSRSITVILDNTSPVATLLYPSKEDIGICKVINSNTVSIIGTTIDAHFSSYRIELKAMREGDTPSDWTTINESESQKETQVLGVWNTLQFTRSRWYYIRVVSSDKVNNTSIDTVSVYLGNPEVKLIFGTKGKDNGEFRKPCGIAFSPAQTGTDNSGCIFVTDVFNHRVQKFDLNGNFLLSFGGLGIKDGKFICPAGIAIDNESCTVYVADMVTNKIQAFDLQGRFLYSFGGIWQDREFDWDKECDFVEEWCYMKKGWHRREQRLRHPLGISTGLYYTFSDTGCTTTKAVFIADRNNDRIAIFDIQGNFLSEIEELNKPEGVFVDSKGNIFVANTKENAVYVYSSSLTRALIIEGLNRPKAVCADSRAYIYVSDSRNNAAKKYNKYGELLMQFTGTCTTALDKPAGICLDREGNLWIADEENDRIIKIGAPTVDDTFSRRILSLPRTAKTIKDAYAYPVPFKPSAGHTGINFRLYSNLNVVLRIYNIAGELVFEQTGITSGLYMWNAKNNWEEPVASGVYIYFLTDDTREKKIGKIIVIR